MDKRSWKDLIGFFKSPFDKIHDIKMLLFIGLPVLYTFKTDEDNKMFVAYLLDLDRDKFFSTWLLTETSKDEVVELLKGNISIRELLTSNKDLFHIVKAENEVCADYTITSEELYANFNKLLPKENFTLSNKIINEVDLNEVYEELMYSV